VRRHSISGVERQKAACYLPFAGSTEYRDPGAGREEPGSGVLVLRSECSGLGSQTLDLVTLYVMLRMRHMPDAIKNCRLQ
jgi:hypothetical protein